MTRSFLIGLVAALAVLVSAGSALGMVIMPDPGIRACNRGNRHATTNEVAFAKVISVDGKCLGFQSHTKPHADGLLLD
jgi:hypothetical protein